MKAMILAAGMGTRLRPLTDHTPKPLISVRGKALIEHHLFALQKIGVDDIVINVAYQGKKLMDFLGNGEKYGVKITYSFEENGPYGTGGGVFQALPILGNDSFLVISADIYTEFPFEKLLTQPIKKAHLVMVENPSWHPNGDYGFKNGYITLDSPRFTYASFGLISRRLFENASAGNYGLSKLFDEAIKENAVSGELFKGIWHNIGTIEDLQAAEAY